MMKNKYKGKAKDIVSIHVKKHIKPQTEIEVSSYVNGLFLILLDPKTLEKVRQNKEISKEELDQLSKSLSTNKQIMIALLSEENRIKDFNKNKMITSVSNPLVKKTHSIDSFSIQLHVHNTSLAYYLKTVIGYGKVKKEDLTTYTVDHPLGVEKVEK
jgi:hypothetical protein